MSKHLYLSTTLFVGGTRLEVRQVMGRGNARYPLLVQQALLRARQWLMNVPPFLHVGGDAQMASAFRHVFRAAPDATALNTLRAVNSNILRGLSDQVLGIKLLEDDGALGYVRRYYSGRKHLVYGAQFHDAKDNAIARRGEIHLSPSILDDPEMATITLVHEAGHKFSNLRDHGDKGYFSSDGRNYEQPGITPQEAMLNADSHAYFTLFMNRRLDKLNRRIAAQQSGDMDLGALFG